MFLTGLGALLIFGGLLYMLRATIWRGPLAVGLHLDRFAARWNRLAGAWDSLGSHRTGRE